MTFVGGIAAPSSYRYAAPSRTVADTALDGDTDNFADQFQDWRDGLNGASADYLANVDAARDRFLAVAERARTSGGMDDPRAFVASLGTDDLAALQHAHGLADPINPAALDTEGAFNLLQVSGQGIDLNHDGLTRVGIGSTILFPPTNAPQNVRDAWASAESGLTDGDRLSFTLMGWIGAGGPFAEGAAPYARPDYDWSALAQRMVDSAGFDLRHASTPALQDQALQKMRFFQDFFAKL